MKRPEQALQIAVVDYLTRALPPHAWFCHIPNGGRRGKVEGAVFKRMGVRAGAPDLLVICAGNVLAIEFKSAKGSLSVAQKLAHNDLRRAGAYVVTCRSLAEVEGALLGFGVPLGARVAA